LLYLTGKKECLHPKNVTLYIIEKKVTDKLLHINV